MAKLSTLTQWVLSNKLEFWTLDQLGTTQSISQFLEIITLSILLLEFKMVQAKNQLPC